MLFAGIVLLVLLMSIFDLPKDGRSRFDETNDIEFVIRKKKGGVKKINNIC